MENRFKRWENLSEILPKQVEEFCNRFYSREELLKEIEEFGKREKVPILLPSTAALLRLIVQLLKPEKVLEIGTGIGYSTLTIYYGWPKAKIKTVDLNRQRLRKAEEFFKKAGAPIETVEGDGLEVIREELASGNKYDLIFIDSTKGEYPFFNYKVEPLLKERGLAIFDNVLFRGMVAEEPNKVPQKYRRGVSLLKLFLTNLANYPNFKSIIIPIGDGIAVHYRHY